MERGGILSKLGYPELVLGDTYKALLLIKEGRKAISDPPDAGDAVIQACGTKLDFWSDEYPRTRRLRAAESPLMLRVGIKLRDKNVQIYKQLLLALL